MEEPEDVIVGLLQNLSPHNKERKSKLLNMAAFAGVDCATVFHRAVICHKLNVVNLLLDEGAGKCKDND